MNDCIMKPNDYIAAADVNKLTADQWQQFRAYIRSYGYQILSSNSFLKFFPQILSSNLYKNIDSNSNFTSNSHN